MCDYTLHNVKSRPARLASARPAAQGEGHRARHRPRKKAAQLRACTSCRHGRDASTFSMRAFHAA
jgi:hypothetical protein